MRPADIDELFRRLEDDDPAPGTEFEHADPYGLLVAVVLAARATDATVNKATRALFEAAGTPQKMVALGEERLMELIGTISLYKGKARKVIGLSRILVERHGGRVPRTRETTPAGQASRADFFSSVDFSRLVSPCFLYSIRKCRSCQIQSLAQSQLPRNQLHGR